MRLVTLSLLEIVLGTSWGVIASLYAFTLVSEGYENIYGFLAIITSLIAILSTMLTGFLYNYRIKKFLMPLAALSITLSMFELFEGKLVLLPILLGLASGIHGVSSLYAVSNLEGSFKKYSIVYASSLFGLSFGAFLVAISFARALYFILATFTILAGFTYTKFVSSNRLNARTNKEETKIKKFPYMYLLPLTVLRRCNWHDSLQCRLLFDPKI
ncbi:MAG: hypothetical protein QFX40_02960 [Archaeoglobales archaeon]|nr:hypothetical protein [Archaeoglobales archaeon]